MVDTNKELLSKIWLSVSLAASIGYLYIPQAATAMPQMMQQKISEVFKTADKNKDGKLTPTEAKTGKIPDPVLKNFKQIDTAKDGTITIKEIITAFDKGIIKP